MIKIKKSATADTRTCDWSKVTKEELFKASEQHIQDVREGMYLLITKMHDAARDHDHTKISGIDQFHKDFSGGFKTTEWWDNHRVVERHHLEKDDGVPADINLVDVLEFITDCTMAGLARSGSVRPLIISDATLRKAFENTCELLKKQVEVEE